MHKNRKEERKIALKCNLEIEMRSKVKLALHHKKIQDQTIELASLKKSKGLRREKTKEEAETKLEPTIIAAVIRSTLALKAKSHHTAL